MILTQRQFLNLYVSTALAISCACVTVSINSIKVEQALADRVPVISVEKDRTLISVALPTPEPAKTERETFEAWARSAAALCGIKATETERYLALIMRESTWNKNAISKSGAVGLAQVKPSTAADVSEYLNVFDPWENLVAGACYLRQQLDANNGDWGKALHSYHAGPNRKETTQQTKDYATDILKSGGHSNRK